MSEVDRSSAQEEMSFLNQMQAAETTDRRVLVIQKAVSAVFEGPNKEKIISNVSAIEGVKTREGDHLALEERLASPMGIQMCLAAFLGRAQAKGALVYTNALTQVANAFGGGNKSELAPDCDSFEAWINPGTVVLPSEPNMWEKGNL